jgi:hypothetical protein
VTAYGSAYNTVNVATGSTPTVQAASAATLDVTYTYPVRCLARIKVPTTASVSPEKVFVRGRLQLGTGGSNYTYTPWRRYHSTPDVWCLMDLGTFSELTELLERVQQASVDYTVALEFKTTNGVTSPVRVDYIELVFFQSFMKLSGISLGNGDKAVYEAVAKIGTFHYTIPDPQAYEMTNAGAFVTNAQRAGTLDPMEPNDLMLLWIAGQTATTHTIADTARLTLKSLRRYQSGLRGAG